MIDVNALPLQGEGGLIDLLKTLVDPRQPRGVRHPVVTVVGIAVCAALSGARSFCAIGEWAQGLTREALQRLGSKRWTPPSEPTIRRVLQGLDANRLDAQIGQWVARQQLRPGVAVAVDGKSLRRSHEAGERAPHLLSAILHQEAVVVAQMDVEEKTNEIPKLPALLAPLPLQGTVVTADALHTQKETARYLVEEKTGRLSIHRQRQSADAAPRHRRFAFAIYSPLSTPRSIKVMAAWKSAPSGPARNYADTWTSPMWRKSSPSGARSRRWFRRNPAAKPCTVSAACPSNGPPPRVYSPCAAVIGRSRIASIGYGM